MIASVSITTIFFNSPSFWRNRFGLHNIFTRLVVLQTLDHVLNILQLLLFFFPFHLIVGTVVHVCRVDTTEDHTIHLRLHFIGLLGRTVIYCTVKLGTLSTIVIHDGSRPLLGLPRFDTSQILWDENAIRSRRLLIISLLHYSLMLCHFGRLKFNITVLFFVFLILLDWPSILFLLKTAFHLLLILIECLLVGYVILEWAISVNFRRLLYVDEFNLFVLIPLFILVDLLFQIGLERALLHFSLLVQEFQSWVFFHFLFMLHVQCFDSWANGRRLRPLGCAGVLTRNNWHPWNLWLLVECFHGKFYGFSGNTRLKSAILQLSVILGIFIPLVIAHILLR